MTPRRGGLARLDGAPFLDLVWPSRALQEKAKIIKIYTQFSAAATQMEACQQAIRAFSDQACPTTLRKNEGTQEFSGNLRQMAVGIEY